MTDITDIQILKGEIAKYEALLDDALIRNDLMKITLFGDLIKTENDTLNLLLRASIPAGKIQLLSFVAFWSYLPSSNIFILVVSPHNL